MELADNLVKCVTANGRIGAYAPDFETALGRLCLEVLRDENPLLRHNYGGGC